MALKPKARPAPRAIVSPAVWPTLFSATRKASILARKLSSSATSAIGLSMPRKTSILFDLDHAIEVLRGIDRPMAEVVEDESLHAKLEALRVSLKSAAQTAGDMIARGAGLAFGFNAMDGD